jgi:hypothetical protein
MFPYFGWCTFARVLKRTQAFAMQICVANSSPDSFSTLVYARLYFVFLFFLTNFQICIGRIAEEHDNGHGSSLLQGLVIEVRKLRAYPQSPGHQV